MISRVLTVASLAVWIALQADALIFNRDVKRALLEALVSEKELVRCRLVTTCAESQAAFTCLAGGGARLT